MNALFGLIVFLAAMLWVLRRLARTHAAASAGSDESEPPFALEARGGDLLEAVRDSRIAAAGLMAAVASLEGPISPTAWRTIRVECKVAFRLDQRSSDEFAEGGRWLAEQFSDHTQLAQDLTAKLHALAPREAHEELVGMLKRVAEADGGAPSDAQFATIHRTMRDLDLV